jgi:hypothetical protein
MQRVEDQHWSLAMALAWITYRSRQAVIDIKYGKWTPSKIAIVELLSALRSGKLIAHGMLDHEPVPHTIETAVWSSLEIKIKRKIFAGHGHLPTAGIPVVIAHRNGHPRVQLLHVTVPAAKVRNLWPAAKRTAAAEVRCLEYLVTEMKRCLDRAPKRKRDFLTDCQRRFPGLSARAFERAWDQGINQSGAVKWRKAGRPPKSSQ